MTRRMSYILCTSWRLFEFNNVQKDSGDFAETVFRLPDLLSGGKKSAASCGSGAKEKIIYQGSWGSGSWNTARKASRSMVSCSSRYRATVSS